MYIAFKIIHVFAVIMFVGNITVGVFWKAWADRTKDARIIANTIDGIIAADRIFTIPGIVLLLIGGIGAALVGHIPILGTGWILWPIVLFIISGIAFGPVGRSQRLLSAVAHEAIDAGSINWEIYDRFSGIWNFWGTIALVAPLIAALIMIAKPALPAFHA
ncbi:MAG: DUF2269 family protein [Candidatus Eremiobacteraeota bacterium]|nr:DUF2269 family protein [Candidatus Eremiobacteraeota bacterium]MBV8365480.1 DUF2269 family protein [Candidatus Eremiobacteraeota bacterium]